MKKVLIVMMLLAQSAGVHAQANLEDRQTANTPPPPIAHDHTALKGQRQTPSHPTIRITRSETFPQRRNNRIYDVDFVIQSNENIPDIDNPASYKIARCLVDENCATQDATTYTPSNITTTSLRFARIRTAITLNNLADIRATWGFVLLRASASALRDADENAPINTKGETIDPDDILGVVGKGAIARRDRIPPEITLSFRQIRYLGKGISAITGLRNDDDVYRLIFWVIPPVNKTIPTLLNITSYRLIRVSDTDDREIFQRRSLRGELIRPFGRPDSLQLTIDVNVLNDEPLSTGFMLARFQDNSLLDIWGNSPVRADGTPIGTGIDGLLSTTPISLSLARNIKARIRAKVFLEGPLR